MQLAAHDGTCAICNAAYRRGEPVAYRAGQVVHSACFASPQGEAQDTAYRDYLLTLMHAAAEWFARQFTGSPAEQYARQRGLLAPHVNLPTWWDQPRERFLLGYAPRDGGLLAHLRKVVQPTPGDDDLLAVGLIAQSGSSSFFRGRLIIPIRQTINGKPDVTGFVARDLDGRQPKYINSPQTVLFDKSKTVFGLDTWCIRAMRLTDHAYLVEGQLDAVTSYQHGYPATVACMGSTVTLYHLNTIAQYASSLTAAFDGDAAGFQAAENLLQTTTTRDVWLGGQPVRIPAYPLAIKIAILPDNEDPDSLLRTNHKAYRRALGTAVDAGEFILRRIKIGLSARPSTQEALSALSQWGTALLAAEHDLGRLPLLHRAIDMLSLPDSTTNWLIKKNLNTA